MYKIEDFKNSVGKYILCTDTVLHHIHKTPNFKKGKKYKLFSMNNYMNTIRMKSGNDNDMTNYNINILNIFEPIDITRKRKIGKYLKQKNIEYI